MCKAPLNLVDGTVVACRKCSQCRARRISDWVGRNIAESKTAVASHAVTLTYGRDERGDVQHARSVILTYSDVQKWLKRLRVEGYPVHFFATGERGSKNGRCHWHVVLHWLEAVPDVRINEPFFDGAWWSHGWSHWTEGTSAANVAYNCKYVLKDVKSDELGQRSIPQMSKKPPLGYAYFCEMAERYVQQGLAPQDLFYSFPEVRRRKRNGSEEVIPFMLTGRSAELFLEHYVSVWRATYPGRQPPESELVNDWLEWGVTATPESPARYAEFVARRRVGSVVKPPTKAPFVWTNARLEVSDQMWDDWQWEQFLDGEKAEQQRQFNLQVGERQLLDLEQYRKERGERRGY